MISLSHGLATPEMDVTFPQLNRYFIQITLYPMSTYSSKLTLSNSGWAALWDRTPFLPRAWGDLHWWISPSWQVKATSIFPHNFWLIDTSAHNFGTLKHFLSRVVDSVIEGIPNPSRTADNVLETSLTPVELLDILGFSGHRVVGVSSKNNKMVLKSTWRS